MGGCGNNAWWLFIAFVKALLVLLIFFVLLIIILVGFSNCNIIGTIFALWLVLFIVFLFWR
jgi:hypothetical protein